MTKIFEKMERIQYLMKELNNELNLLPTYEEELNGDLKELVKEENDIRHIIENIKLTNVESDEVVSRMHELRDELRQAKDLLCLVTPFKHATKHLNDELVSKIEEVSIFNKRNSAVPTYTFRTKKGFDLMQKYIKNFDERSRVKVKAPNSYVNKAVVSDLSTFEETVVSDLATFEEAVVSIVPTVNTEPIQELVVIPESSIHYMIIKNDEQWHLKKGTSTVCQDTNFEIITDFLIEKGWKTIRTKPSCMRELKLTIRELKKKETEFSRIRRYALIQQHL